MAARDSSELDAAAVVRAISRFAGTLVAAVVVTGRKVTDFGAKRTQAGRRQLEKAHGKKKSTRPKKRAAAQPKIQALKPGKSTRGPRRTTPKASAGSKGAPEGFQSPENIESGA